MARRGLILCRFQQTPPFMVSTLFRPSDTLPTSRRGLPWSRRRSALSAIVYAALVLAPLAAPAESFAGSLEGIPICHGFGCRYEESVSITAAEWNQIKSFFRRPAKSPEGERDQIRKATGWFEVIIGRHTPIHLDKGRNEIPAGSELAGLEEYRSRYDSRTVGQMDCIDESLNMTTYLRLLEKAGLFKYHRVVKRAHRQSAVDQHYAGQIEEVNTGKRWVVDSWFYGYGSLPVMESAREWNDIPFLFSTAW